MEKLVEKGGLPDNLLDKAAEKIAEEARRADDGHQQRRDELVRERDRRAQLAAEPQRYADEPARDDERAPKDHPEAAQSTQCTPGRCNRKHRRLCAI